MSHTTVKYQCCRVNVMIIESINYHQFYVSILIGVTQFSYHSNRLSCQRNDYRIYVSILIGVTQFSCHSNRLTSAVMSTQ